ncbi:hypothetical protein FQA47_021002 [Oryzias melastigma]|uniref:Uncharacterized protein n=1 Tax=Oryzias melastigma TaxID=30732 RepID=A0A834BK55_ORYME|nr:hypothetical protein FQA47_021002 [Oryzias melastigma]
MCVVSESSDLSFPITHLQTWFIYIHGYPDNEAFNPEDPVARTMNPITSRRLRDGMADRETDGGGSRPAMQSHPSPRLPASVFLLQLINRLPSQNTANTNMLIPEVHSRSSSGLRAPPPPPPTASPKDHLLEEKDGGKGNMLSPLQRSASVSNIIMKS